MKKQIDIKQGFQMETLIKIIKTENGNIHVIQTIDGGIKHIRGGK